MSLPRILCVDDEPFELDGFRRIARGHFDLHCVTRPTEALAAIDAGEPFDVVLTDIRMPEASGAELLAEIRKRAPDTTRILLTGQADTRAAIDAVNEGQVFRFLTKPCPADVLLQTLAAAVEQHRLVTAERVLLEETLVGSVRAMTDVLSLVHPSAYGPFQRQHKRARALAELRGLSEPWLVEVASMLSVLGFVVLPDDLLVRLRRAEPLSSAEHRMVSDLHKMSDSVVARIPRLERVAAIIAHQSSWLGKPLLTGRESSRLPEEAAILQIVHDLGVAEELAGSTREALAMLRSSQNAYDASLLEALARICDVPAGRLVALPLSNVRPGMLLIDDIRLDSGALLVARGQRVTEQMLLRLNNGFERRVREPISCEVD